MKAEETLRLGLAKEVAFFYLTEATTLLLPIGSIGIESREKLKIRMEYVEPFQEQYIT
jgi:hypothetical protein